jgi:hypothetical protein
LLASTVDDSPLFPLRLTLKRPGSTDLSEQFEGVRAWARELQQGSKPVAGSGYRIVLREARHRVLGTNSLPDEAWIDTLDDALLLIHKRREAQQFAAIVVTTQRKQPALLPWLARYPLHAVECAAAWPLLLDVVSWLQAHPRPGIYLRQVDLSGVHSKFIEDHRGVLSELLDLSLPEAAIDHAATGVSQFAPRYGFLDKPVRVRLRLLDQHQAGIDQDLTITREAFALLAPTASRVFITENEINFLAFPLSSDSLVIFGAGYGFDALAGAEWLQQREIRYWGDIDTHGFAILDQLRAQFSQVQSFLMDRDTLLAHQSQWVTELQPATRQLSRLHADEQALYEDLQHNRLGDRVRLEQERIGFGWVQNQLRALTL